MRGSSRRVSALDERHVGVKHRLGLRQLFVNGRVNAVAGSLDVARAALDLAVVEADFHEETRP